MLFFLLKNICNFLLTVFVKKILFHGYFLTSQTHHRSQSFNCRTCGEHFTQLVALQDHKRSVHPTQPSASRKRPLQYGEGNSAAQRTFTLVENSLNGAAQTYRLPFNATQNEDVADLNSAVLWSAVSIFSSLHASRISNGIWRYHWYFTVPQNQTLSRILQYTSTRSQCHPLCANIHS